MFFGGVNLKCKQKVMVYGTYEMINACNEKEKASMGIEDTIRFYVDKYGKNLYRAEGLLRYFKKTKFRFPQEHCFIIVAPIASIESIRQKISNPLDDLNTLFIDLAKIKSVLDEKAILRFVQLYGLPVRSQWLFNFQHIDIPLLYLYDFDKELISYKKHFALFLAFKNNDYKQMRKLLQDIDCVDSPKTEAYVSLVARKGIKFKVKTKLTLKIKSRNIRYEPSLGPDGFYMKVEFQDLFDVAYFQMGKSLFSDESLGVCLECGNYFVKTHGNMKYCPPPPNGKRSSCQNNHQVKAYREQIKQKNSSHKNIL